MISSVLIFGEISANLVPQTSILAPVVIRPQKQAQRHILAKLVEKQTQSEARRLCRPLCIG